MKALILVDLQNDFMPGGNLSIKDGNKILPTINFLLKYPFDIVVATKDWHPSNHGSFAINHQKNVGGKIILNGLEQILWPVHCVQHSHGSEFTPEWNSEAVHKIIFKGTDPSIDSYSAFFDNGHLKATGLNAYLKENNIDEVYVAGVATDYCVKYSVLDALELGYKVYVITDACKGVNLSTNDSAQALKEMEQAGAHLITSSEFTG